MITNSMQGAAQPISMYWSTNTTTSVSAIQPHNYFNNQDILLMFVAGFFIIAVIVIFWPFEEL